MLRKLRLKQKKWLSYNKKTCMQYQNKFNVKNDFLKTIKILFFAMFTNFNWQVIKYFCSKILC